MRSKHALRQLFGCVTWLACLLDNHMLILHSVSGEISTASIMFKRCVSALLKKGAEEARVVTGDGRERRRSGAFS